MYLKIKAFLLLTSFILLFNCKDIENKPKENWIQLFNGKDLSDWAIKINGFELNNNYNNTFRVENGILKVSYSNYDSFSNEYGHIFYKKPFTNYRLRLQYRFVEEQVEGGEGWAKKNSGIMFHCQSPESMLIKQGFPVSLEFQLLGGVNKGELRPSGNLCTPGTHVYMEGALVTKHCVNANCKTYYGEEWITAELLVKNDSIAHYIDGIKVISYQRPTIGGEFLDAASDRMQGQKGESLNGGYISLQSESHPIEFKNIEILEL